MPHILIFHTGIRRVLNGTEQKSNKKKKTNKKTRPPQINTITKNYDTANFIDSLHSLWFWKPQKTSILWHNSDSVPNLIRWVVLQNTWWTNYNICPGQNNFIAIYCSRQFPQSKEQLQNFYPVRPYIWGCLTLCPTHHSRGAKILWLSGILAHPILDFCPRETRTGIAY